MRILMLGANHRTAPLDLREKLALGGQSLHDAMDRLTNRFPLAEMVVLSTCNRTELYVARASHESPTFDELGEALSDLSGVDTQRLGAVTIQRENEGAVTHLFRVACGLDSMVLGEPQILGQVKRAYDLAISHKSVGMVLHTVFQQALTCAKQVRAQTGIDRGRISVGSVAVDFARQIFATFRNKIVVGIGAGEMAKLILKHLKALEPARLWVTNRSFNKACDLAAQIGLSTQQGGARAFADLDELLVEADIVLSSTGSREPIVSAQGFGPLLRRRRRRPLFLIDIAVPRDVESTVGTFSNVYLYNLDDIQQVLENTRQNRHHELGCCEQMVCDHVRSTMTQIRQRDLGKLIQQLRKKLHDLGRSEQQRTLRKLASAAPERAGDILEEGTQRLVNKILHLPLSKLDLHHNDAPLGFYTAALRRLFDLEGVAEGGGPIVEKKESDPRPQIVTRPLSMMKDESHTP